MQERLERLFQLRKHQTTVKTELASGATMFLASLYILFVNGIVLAETGMPEQGVFIATALTAAVCTLFMALFANMPMLVAPGTSINALFAYVVCIGAGYHWKEALAIVFLAGLLHVLLAISPARKAMISAVPEHIGIAAGAGLGVFIAQLAVRNAGILEGRRILDGAAAYEMPRVFADFNLSLVIFLLAAVVMLVMLAWARRGGEKAAVYKYAALPISILVTTFICLPLNFARVGEATAFTGTLWRDFREVAFSFFGTPGLGSVFASPGTAARTLLVVLILAFTNILDSISGLLGLGYMEKSGIFDHKEMELFKSEPMTSRMDRAVIANSFGGVLAPLFGSPTAVLYLETATGILLGGRTGLAGVAAGICFLLCIPLAWLFRLIPTEAVAPAMILAGGSMMTRVGSINWRKLEEAVPAFVMILMIPLTNSVLDGISIGLLCYLAVVKRGKGGTRVSPVLYCVAGLYILVKVLETLV